MLVAARTWAWIIGASIVGALAGVASFELLMRGKEDGALAAMFAAPCLVAVAVLVHRSVRHRSPATPGRRLLLGPVVTLLIAAAAFYVVYEANCPGVQDLC
jgi:uncharacterized membrane protein (UPF0136 family)